MTQIIRIDPITRIEGHLAISVKVEDHKVVEAQCSGEMFRGFEMILRGRDPMDAQQITQRICGVCPISHGLASCLSQDDAYKINPPTNGRLMRNIIQASNYLQSHVLHFYHLSALDFVDIAAILQYQGHDPQLNHLKAWVKEQVGSKSIYPAAPFLPRLEGNYITDLDLNIGAIKHYLQALDIRQKAHQAVAVFGGKVPHATALLPGGVTEQVTAKAIAQLKSLFTEIQTFVEHSYIPDVVSVAQAFPDYFSVGKSYGNYLAYGVFNESDDGRTRMFPSGVVRNGVLEEFNPEKIAEFVAYSYFSSASGLHPSKGETKPAPDKHEQAYSWLKAPRYDGVPMEVGPLARVMVSYLGGKNPALNAAVDGLLSNLKLPASALNSVLGRHAARALEAKFIAARGLEWIDSLQPGKPGFQSFTIPKTASGMGLWEAPRGALGHWIEIADHRIRNYQCVVPSTWNCSPRDDKGQPGTIEKALEGTPVADPDNPIEAPRVVRSFDPCIACAVH